MYNELIGVDQNKLSSNRSDNTIPINVNSRNYGDGNGVSYKIFNYFNVRGTHINNVKLSVFIATEA